MSSRSRWNSGLKHEQIKQRGVILGSSLGQLEVFDEITNPNTQGFGNPQKRVKADPLLSPFNFANINRMQISLFRQLFLTHSNLVAVFPNGVSKRFKVLSRACHSGSGKQGGLELKTPNKGLFFRLHYLWEVYRLFIEPGGKLGKNL